jgi:hypothetical protein
MEVYKKQRIEIIEILIDYFTEIIEILNTCLTSTLIIIKCTTSTIIKIIKFEIKNTRNNIKS